METRSPQERAVAALTHHVRAVMELFGVSPEPKHSVVQPDELPAVVPGQIILITGPSGAGKSTLLAGVLQQLTAKEKSFTRLEYLPADQPLAVIDCFPGLTFKEVLALLSCAGLAEARLLLREPLDLSEGERFRFRLAQFYASPAKILVADEFGATLDRITARVVAYNLRQFIRRSPTRSAILATSYEDLARDLQPEVWIKRELGGAL